MRITAMTGAATAALGAVVVAGAAPALAATLTQGTAISAPAGACSLTLVGDTTAYTSAGCGAGEWTVGSPIRTADGELAGTVAALPESGSGLVEIALADDAEVVGEWSTREASTVGAGETVYTHGSSLPLGSANSLAQAASSGADALCTDAGLIPLDGETVSSSDIGGAVYDVDQRVVGVITGLAPVTFDAEGRAVPCDAGATSAVMVPAESFDTAVAAPVAEKKQARPAPKHAMTAEESAATIGVADEDLPTAGEAPVDESELTTFTDAEEEALVEELTARAEDHAQARAESGQAEEVLEAAPAEGVAYGTRVLAETTAGGFDSVTVSAYDADGALLAQDGLELDGEYRAWLPVPAEVPAGGSVVVTVADAAGATTDTTVTLGGTPIG